MILRWTSALVLALAFLAHTFSYYVIIADYDIDTAAYIKNCVNKDKPWMHCNGKCQLHKELAQQQKTSDKQVPERRLGNENPLSCNSFFASLEEVNRSLIIIPYAESAPGKTQSMPRSLFRPPASFRA